MELNSLKFFMNVAEELNFSKAAKKMFVSQPALSYHISNLEKELQTKLFTRNGTKIALTEAGNILYQECKEAFYHLTYAKEAIGKIKLKSNSLRFGFFGWLISMCFSDYVLPFLSEHADIHATSEQLGWDILDNLFLYENLDFVFVRKLFFDGKTNLENLDYISLSKDRFSVLIWSDHPSASRKVLSDLSEFDDIPFMEIGNISSPISHHMFKTLLSRYNYHGVIQKISSMETLLSNVSAKNGFSVVPFYDTLKMPFSKVTQIPLTGGNLPSADLLLVWKKSPMTPAKEMYIEYIRDYLAKKPDI